ncbi:MAG: phosphonate C-P lyase system protein PhnH [Halobacteria archaeon]|nr:phosphonate C-P lyase system protein PhnH [Halobacteria archaeon]
MRAVGIEPVHGTRETFRALVDAMSKPGTVQNAPERADYAVVSTLVDNEIGFYTEDDELHDVLASQGRLNDINFEDANVVHVEGSTGRRVVDANRGTLKEPSMGATVVYRVGELAEGEGSTTVRLEGSGVPGTRLLSLNLPEDEIEAIREANSEFPKGVDVVLTTDDKLAAIPRSSEMEVV